MTGAPLTMSTANKIKVRRISADEATRQALARGPAAIVPPKHLMAQPGESNEVAVAMELASHELEASRPATPSTSKETIVTDKYAFAFDIDGVLIRGGKPIPEAVQAMRMLNGENEYGVKVPYIFVTNGGGKSELERCQQLSEQLEIEVSPGQFICGHTPMRDMAERYRTVLVVGGEGEKCREVAEGYGFQDVITPGDIIKDNNNTTPFRKLTNDENQNSRARNFNDFEIEAIFVFADSRDWASDQQILLDLLMSKKGRLGTRSTTFDEGPPLFFSHNDVVWSTAHDLTRIGMGALRVSLEAMYKAVTGKEIQTTAFGKPQMGTFEFATKLLRQWRKDTHGIDSPPDTVYFVGDTPSSDIDGANRYDAQSDATWYSILVRTGVYQEGNENSFPAKCTVDNVLDAVEHAIDREQKKQLRCTMESAFPSTIIE